MLMKGGNKEKEKSEYVCNFFLPPFSCAVDVTEILSFTFSIKAKTGKGCVSYLNKG